MDDRSDSEFPRVDLSALDPQGDSARTNAAIARIVADGMSARRARADTLVVQVNRWARPALAAAILILAVSIPVAVRSGRQLVVQPQAGAASLAANVAIDRWGLPAPVAALVQSGRSPTAVEIVAAFDARWTGGAAPR